MSMILLSTSWCRQQKLYDADTIPEKINMHFQQNNRTPLSQDIMRMIVRSMKGCSIVLAAVWIAGCATQMGRNVHQFDPLPRAEVDAEELSPIILPMPIVNALGNAEDAYGNMLLAERSGDESERAAAYTRIQENLTGTDIELSTFIALMETHGSILSTAAAQADLANRYRRIWFEDITDGVYSQIHIPDPLPDMVVRELNRIQQGYPRAFQRGLDRSHLYRSYIRAELSNAGLPLELEWLAMVESQFTPKIVSWAGAGGMWQFMRPAAQRYNLRIDNYVDERYNWQSATRAAINYLQDLHNFFDGDWALAVTAYNMGEGGLSRAIDSTNGIRDLWVLMNTPPASTRMKDESKQFYAKFLASVIIGNDPEAYGFEINPVPADSSVRIEVDGLYVLDELDRNLGLDSGTLARLNPDLLQEVTPPTGSYSIAVPVEVQARFRQVLEISAPVMQVATRHRVQRGETINRIADLYGITQQELMDANRIRSARSLRVGQELTIPQPRPMPHGSTSQMARGGADPQSGSGFQRRETYRVQQGDTLFDIARAHDISVQELQRLNNIGRGQRLLVGSVLRVSDGAPSPPPTVASVPERQVVPAGNPIRYHTVRRGEYPAVIARRYNIPLNDFLRWNNLSRNTTIHVGQRLVIAVGTDGAPVETTPAAPQTVIASAPAPAPAPTLQYTTVRHRVARGENAGRIATRYNVSVDDLLAWNNKRRASILRVGEELVIRQPAQQQQTPAPTNTPPSQLPDSHVVAQGETLGAIADRYKIALNDLKTWNGKDDRAMLQVGETIRLHADAPVQAAAQTATAQQTAPPEPQQQTHTVARGETLGGIADKYKVPLRDLLAWNNKTSRSVIQVGEKLTIMSTSTSTTAPAATPAPAPVPQLRTHTVARGETASGIAARYNVTTRDLLAWNNKTANDVLRIGEELTIGSSSGSSAATSAPAAAPAATPAPAPAPQLRTHTVARGETASGIAARYNVTTRDLLAWNNKTANDVLRIGEELTIGSSSGTSAPAAAPAATPAPAPAPQTRTHTVARGDTASGIAARYNVTTRDLLAWNNKTANDVLRIGETLEIRSAIGQSGTQTASASAQSSGQAGNGTVKHVVARGETAGAIAAKYNVSTRDLLAWNNKTANDVLRIGEEFIIHTSGSAQSSTQQQQRNTITHVVSSGQNPTVIAQRYGVSVNDLFEWNAWPNRHVLQIGDEVRIYQ